MSFNKYLTRAMHLKDSPILSRSAKAVNAVGGYVNRLTGSTARNLEARSASASKLRNSAKKPQQKYIDAIKRMSAEARAKSTSTRIKTGIGLTLSSIAYKANKGYDPTSHQYQYTYPESGIPY